MEPQPPVSPAPEAAGMARRAVRGFLWSALSYGGNKLFLFASTLVLTRLLSPADFGVMAAVVAFLAYLEVVLDLGLGASIVYRQDEGRPETVSTAFTLNVVACVVLAVLNLVFAPVVAQFFRLPGGVGLFRLMSVYVLIRSLGGIQEALLERDLRFRDKGIADLIRGVVRGGAGIVLGLAGFGPAALVWAFLAAEVAGTGTTWFMTRFSPRLGIARGTAGSLLRYGAPVAALGLLSELGLNSDYFVVGHVLGATALGLYTIAFRLPELLLSNVYWMFSSVAFPVLSRARATGSQTFRDAVLTSLRLLTMFAFPVSVGLALSARDTILVLFSGAWSGSSTPMVLISLAIGLGCIGYASGDAFKAAGRPGTLLWVNTASTVIMLVAFIVAAPHGITAVAAVHLVTTAVYAVVRLGLANSLAGTTTADALRAMDPAFRVTLAIAVVALPVRLLLPAGPVTLVSIVLAGLAGAAVGLLTCGQETRTELWRTAAALRR